jgi:hypothetical protein
MIKLIPRVLDFIQPKGCSYEQIGFQIKTRDVVGKILLPGHEVWMAA